MKLGKIILLNSIKEKVGKTTVLRNLAGALAEEGKKILIIDFSENDEDYLKFFKFDKYSDLSKVYTKELSLQTVKLIYPENRSISIIKNKEKKKFSKKFIEELLPQIKKTYDYIFIEIPTKENKNPNIKLLTEAAIQNIIIIEQEFTSIKEINKIKEKYKNVKNHSVLLNKYNYKLGNEEGFLLNLEDLFKLIKLKFIGVIEEENNEKNLNIPSCKIPHSKLHLSTKRISQRIIKNKFLEKVSNIKFENSFSIEILYKKFDITEKKTF